MRGAVQSIRDFAVHANAEELADWLADVSGPPDKPLPVAEVIEPRSLVDMTDAWTRYIATSMLLGAAPTAAVPSQPCPDGQLLHHAIRSVWQTGTEAQMNKDGSGLHTAVVTELCNQLLTYSAAHDRSLGDDTTLTSSSVDRAARTLLYSDVEAQFRICT